MNSKHAVFLENVNKTFYIREKQRATIFHSFKNLLKKKVKKREIKALKNINLSISKGEIFGVIGRNGSGKSTLLNVLMESIKPDKGGIVLTKGTMIRLALGMGIDPNLSARDNIYVNGTVIGLTFKKIDSIFENIITFAGLDKYVDTKVKFYSKGMKQRLMFSIAMHVESDIILLDEFFGGTGDKEFRQKSEKAFEEKILEGRTIIIVSHNMSIIKKHCKRGIWIEHGEVKMLGSVNEICEKYEASFEMNEK